MKMQNAAMIAGLILLTVTQAGCQSSRSQLTREDTGQVQLRATQTRAFDTTDRTATLRSVIATLQDLGFVVDAADEKLGSVSATKLEGYEMRMTVTVRPGGEHSVLVRASAQLQLRAVAEPKLYQDFFTALEKSMFFAAQNVE